MKGLVALLQSAFRPASSQTGAKSPAPSQSAKTAAQPPPAPSKSPKPGSQPPADQASNVSTPTAPPGIVQILAVIARWQDMTAEITNRTAEAPGGVFRASIVEAAEVLAGWLETKTTYLTHEVGSLLSLGAADAFIAATIKELNNRMASLVEALAAASTDETDIHFSKYIHYLGVCSDSIGPNSLPILGQKAHYLVRQMVKDLQHLIEEEKPQKKGWSSVSVPQPSADTSAHGTASGEAAAHDQQNGQSNGDGAVVLPFSEFNGDGTVIAATGEGNGDGTLIAPTGAANGDVILIAETSSEGNGDGDDTANGYGGTVAAVFGQK